MLFDVLFLLFLVICGTKPTVDSGYSLPVNKKGNVSESDRIGSGKGSNRIELYEYTAEG